MARLTTTRGKRPTKGYTLGRRGFAKISAIEGIRLTPAMDEDFRDLDRRRLSAEERRQILLRKYGKRR